MKKLLFVLMFGAVMFAGCAKKEEAPVATPEVAPATDTAAPAADEAAQPAAEAPAAQ